MVDSPDTFEQRLEENYDVILSDHNVGSWTASDALEIVRHSEKDTRMVTVTTDDLLHLNGLRMAVRADWALSVR